MFSAIAPALLYLLHPCSRKSDIFVAGGTGFITQNDYLFLRIGDSQLATKFDVYKITLTFLEKRLNYF
ncbi:hypothetical protein PLIP_a0605 [Pseudoalteromonas lipolytica LMEB 39]|nr:hypothetical protein [Pseudoalteromonas lipolytica LMEB 39]